MAKTQVNILKVAIYPDGNGTVVTSASAANKQGAWNLTAKQLARLASSAGITPRQLAMVKGTMTIEGKNVKAGEKWTEVDRKTGEVIKEGTFTKDHFRVEELTLELSVQSQMALLAAESISATLLVSAPATAIAAPIEAPIAVPEEFQEPEVVS
jgi:hypothetical protein